jgi:hypothetical protein
MFEGEPESEGHKLVMYSSPRYVDQYFSQYTEDISKIVRRKSRNSTVEAGMSLGNVIASLKGAFRRKSGKELIKEINFDDELRQVRALMEVFSDSELVYSLEDFKRGEKSPTGLYHFDTDLQVVPREEGEDKMYQVRGIQDDVDFSGVTSKNNWSSRSFVNFAVSNVDPFPFEGVFKPIDIEHRHIREGEHGPVVESVEVKVQFIYILQPDVEDYESWSNYQKLVRDHPRDLNEFGVENQ